MRIQRRSSEPLGFLTVCEHVFVTAQGSAYARLRRAIERRNTLVAWATAAELARVELGDALALVLLALDTDAPAFREGRRALALPALPRSAANA
jgi:hypothetical protein